MFNKPINRWWTVLAGAMGCMVSAGTIAAFTFGIFINAISAEYGWSRGTVTYCLSAFVLASGVGHLMLGSIINRWGVRGPSILFVGIFAAALAAVSILPPSVGLFYLVFAIMGYFGAAATPMPYATAISAWFDKKRGLALGLMITGAGVGAPILVFYAKYLLTHYGWRAGYLGLGILAGTIGLFGLVVLVRMPPVYNSAAARAERAQKTGVPTLWQIYTKSRTFWLIAFPLFAFALAGGMHGNMVPLLTDRGLSMTAAVSMLSGYGVATTVSTPIIGYLMDRLFIPYAAAGAFLTGMVGLVLIWSDVSNLMIYIGMIFFGMAVGTQHPLMAMLVSRYFTMREYSKVLGAVWILLNIGNSVGNMVAGFCFDLTRSYEPAIGFFVVTSMIAVVTILRLGPYSSVAMIADHAPGGSELSMQEIAPI